MPTMQKTLSFGKAKKWEEKLEQKGYVRHRHRVFDDGWYLWVKKGYRSYSIVWEEHLEQYVKIYNLPAEHTIYWRMDKDLSYLFDVKESK